jgi:hypothetical protein
MKIFSLKFTSHFFLLILVLISCNEQDKPISESERLAKIALTSDAFKSLNVSSTQLNLTPNDRAILINDQKKSLVIPFKDGSGRIVIFKFDSSDNTSFAILFEAVSGNSTSMDQINDEFLSHKFSGNLHFTTSQSNKVTFNFKNSILIANKEISNKGAKCGGWTDEGHGSPFSCAGRRIEQMGTASKIECYLAFLVCLAVQVADCVEDGCKKQSSSNP